MSISSSLMGVRVCVDGEATSWGSIAIADEEEVDGVVAPPGPPKALKKSYGSPVLPVLGGSNGENADIEGSALISSSKKLKNEGAAVPAPNPAPLPNPPPSPMPPPNPKFGLTFPKKEYGSIWT